MHRHISLIFIFIILICPGVYGNEIKSHELVKICEENNVEYKLDFCRGYINGMLDSIWLGSPVDEEKFLCFPGSITAEELRKTYLKWMTEHPEENEKDAVWSLFGAITDTYPC